ncbi:hypodermin-A-like isoform X2 [Aethina tumida]|uniref:hypodermin-A-like isoform X2 n=1 Tax=Aethina tumida TaxID=116153 RepID=UPI0021488CEF|nr:hypodermin-A-like isoform X2 [Aethina tumida]
MWSRMDLIFSLLVLTASTLVGGKDATISDHPYHASISENGLYICGGSIVGRRKIVTAAHCDFNSASDLTVRVGSPHVNTLGEVLNVEKVIRHPKFQDDINDYNVLVIVLSSDITDPHAKQIEMANIYETTRHYSNGVITGWQIFSSGKLQVKNVTSYNACLQSSDFSITDYILCGRTAGETACLEDTGGPLVVNNVLVGIVLYEDDECEEGYLIVYTKISKIRSFIDSIDSGVTSVSSTRMPIQVSNDSNRYLFEHFIIFLLTSITIKYYI